MGEDVRLKQLVSSLKNGQCNLDTAVESSLSYIREGGGGERAHSYLCAALLQRDGVGGKTCSSLLQCLGPAPALLVAHANLPRVAISCARWLCREIETFLDSSSLSCILDRECSSPSPTLTPGQQQLLSALTHLPDLLANRLGPSVPPSLLPSSLFPLLGSALLTSLHSLHSNLKDGRDRSLVFLGALLSKAAMLGHAKSMLSQLVPTLQQKSCDDPLWRRVCHSLFCRVSSLAMEPLLMELVQLLPPYVTLSLLSLQYSLVSILSVAGSTHFSFSSSLANPHPLYLLLGDLAVTNQKARHIFSHKLWLARLPSNENSAYNLIGYLMSWGAGQELLGESLRSAMGVWSDGGSVRRMDSRQHLWLCRLLVLGTTCLSSHLTPPTSLALKEGVMKGLQIHLETAVPGVRERGMATGQSLLNTLHSRPKDQQLHFDLRENPDTDSIHQLARPVTEQQKSLQEMTSQLHDPQPPSDQERGDEKVADSKRLVRVREATDSDSDDELEPFDMSHDPDHTQSPPPHYLRDCLSVLVSPTERGPVEATLSSLPSLVSRDPADLSEVCEDLAKALVHLQDTWDLPAFSSLRHSALVSLTTARPHLLAPFLVTEFYSPHHNLRQRLDILEVMSSAATELSSPSTDVTPSPPPPPLGKPWQQEVEERLRAKTRIISKGPKKPPPLATPNRFSSVAPLFFYPLIASYDRALPSLDLLGRDSLLLGHLVRVLGNVVWCASHALCQPAMSRTLLEFLWAIRYHHDSFVRQAVLCALNMAVVATPTNYLLSDLQEPLLETMLWVQDVGSSDGDDEVRALAAHSLSILAKFTRDNT